jgi:hypothetical protein
MKRLVSPLLCLSLSIFTVARAMKPSHMLDMSEAEEQEVAAEEDTDEQVASDDDSMEDASNDEGEDISNDDAGDDDAGGVDDGGDDGGDYTYSLAQMLSGCMAKPA